MLFYPWRDEENDLLNGFKTFKEHFKTVKKEIKAKKIEYDASAALVDKIEEATITKTVDNFDDVSSNIESVEANDALQQPTTSPTYAFYSPQSHEHAYHDLGADIGFTIHIRNDNVEMIQNMLSESDYLKLLSRLNSKQREIFTHLVHSLTIRAHEQLCVFITGGAGVGKSVVIRNFISDIA